MPGLAADFCPVARRCRSALGDRSAQLTGTAARVSAANSLLTDLASRTNLLALNAAIEAARGYAVVATEVKEVAGQIAHPGGDLSCSR